MPDLISPSFRILRHSAIRLWEHLPIHGTDNCILSCDFWLVCHSKDQKTAIFTIESIVRYSINPIGKIFIISNESTRPDWIPDYVIYIHEDALPVTQVARTILCDLPYRGWILQQLLKFSGVKYSRRFVVIDCDTILLRPHLFYTDDATVLRLSYEHSPHYRYFERSLDINGGRFFSFTCHMIPYKSELLEALMNSIESKTGQPWPEYICKYAAEFGMSVNEYDLYARFIIQNGESIRYLPWLNKSAPVRTVTSLDDLVAAFPGRNSVSLHNNSDRELTSRILN